MVSYSHSSSPPARTVCLVGWTVLQKLLKPFAPNARECSHTVLQGIRSLFLFSGVRIISGSGLMGISMGFAKT